MEDSEYVGVGARFGPTLESKERRANHTRVVLADPPDCCAKPKNKVLMKSVSFLLQLKQKFSFFKTNIYLDVYAFVIWSAFHFF